MRGRIAILTADWHLSEKVPLCRAETPEEWRAVQEKYLGMVRHIAKGLPILHAGDIFDRWDVPPSTINWAIKALRGMQISAVPGNHDTPNHSLDQLHRSAYWTLGEAGVIATIGFNGLRFNKGLLAIGFPWGEEPRPWRFSTGEKGPRIIEVAVVHKYIWDSRGTAYPGASEDDNLSRVWKNFEGYDAVVVGDNHKGWSYNSDRKVAYKPAIFNPGTFLRRKADEINHKPSVGVLYDDGTIEPHYLDVSGDRFVEAPEKVEEIGLDSEEFLKELMNLADASIDYREAVKRFMKTNTTKQEVREFVTRLMEDRKDG